MFETIASLNPLGVLVWSKSGKIIFTNASFLKLLSFEKSPNDYSDICSEDEIFKELELLKILHSSSKKFKSYSKYFLASDKALKKMDVMTYLVTISDEEHYCSQIRSHKITSILSRGDILKKQNDVLLKLTKSETIDSGDLEASVREITEAATEALNCQRSSVWFYTEENKSILIMDLYQSHLLEHSNGVELFAKDFPAYFKYLGEERVLGANDAHSDPSTFEFSEVYLSPLNIKSMLDAPIRLHGKMVGVICNETVGNSRNWIAEELNFSASLADLISRAIEAKIRKKAEDEIKEINENLELKVKEQTKEIREKLTEITSLKEFQDGDYYLTSLILNPLIKNKNTSKTILTDFIVRQKKQFQFRKETGQIGGDFCITDTISFNAPDEKFLFFLNADAMGKSMQGASGAIVLGTAILNILWQIKTRNYNPDQTPREWLELALLELNNIFLTFKGSMLVSGFFGLICEKNLELYFSNFEHPNAIVYRDNKSNFLIPKSTNFKLGQNALTAIPIEVFQLYSADILVIGSDGRDDIEISSDQEGRRINDDETLILKLVDECGGDISELERLIKRKGDLIDDLSLMKIMVL